MVSIVVSIRPVFPPPSSPKPTGQIARIDYGIRDFAGLECDALTAG
jgi:hypothetical protein